MLNPRAVGLRAIEDTAFAVVDVETTGLVPGADRIVEIAIVRMIAGERPVVTFETLVNPVRPMAATEIHGLTDEDVADAPRFDEIAGDFIDAIRGCCVAAYNADFDVQMLERELQQVGVRRSIPYVCLLGIRADLGIGGPCALEEACRAHDVAFHAGHFAGYDARSEAELLVRLLPLIKSKGSNGSVTCSSAAGADTASPSSCHPCRRRTS